MLRNKHVIAALIITPILSVLGYFAVDFMVTEKPHAARPGGTYQLVARSSCRYASGHCVLANGEFKLDIAAQYRDDGKLLLSVTSAFPLEGSKVAVVASEELEGTPVDMQVQDETRQQWQVIVAAPAAEKGFLRLVAAANDSLYFGETSMQFTHYETSFGEDFRGESQ